MASILDLIDPALLNKGAPDPEPPGEFVKGMRSGTLGMRQGVSNAMGAVGGALGYNEFAADQYQQADALGERAAAAAPRVTSIRDVGGVGDAVDWAAGTLGALVPSAAVGIGAGLLAPASLGVAGAMGAGALAYAPSEVGDVVGRQREAGQPVSLRDAALAGGASAALGSVVPGLVAGKLAGRAISKAPMTMGRAGKAVATDTALEAGTEAGGEASKQLGSTQALDTLDYGQIGDAAAAGALGGGAMGGLGAVGEYGHQNAAKVGQGLDAAKNAATGLLASAKTTAKGVGEAAKGAVDKAKDVGGEAGRVLEGYEIPSKLAGLWDSGTAKRRQMLHQVADSEEIVGDAKEFLTAQGDKLKTMLADNDGQRLQAVKGWVDELAQEKLSPEHYEKLKGAMGDLSDRANQATVAGVKKAQDGFKAASAAVERFMGAVKGHPSYKAATGAKKSEVYSAAKEAIMREVVPVLMETNPELASHPDPQVLNKLAGKLRQFISHIAEGKPLDSDTLLDLFEVTGGKADEVIAAVHRAVDSGDKKQTANVFKALNQIAEVQKSSDSLTQVMAKSLKPEFQRYVKPAELAREASMLQAWATSSRAQLDDPQYQYNDRKVREGLATRYGDKVEAVLTAVEKAQKREANILDTRSAETDEEGNVLSEGESVLDAERDSPDGGKLVFHGAGRKGDSLMLAAEHDPGKGGYDPIATQKLRKLQAADPSRTYRFVTADEMGHDHPWVKEMRSRLVRAGDVSDVDGEKYADQEINKYGAITAEHSRQDTQLSFDELDAMKLDTHKYGDSKSRINTGEGGPVLDAVKVSRAMHARFKDEYAGNDSKSPAFRLARMFVEGIAAVQEHTGKSFVVPDETVIGRIDGHDMTFGEAKKLDARSEKDVARDTDSKYLVELRKEFRRVSGLDPKTGKRVAPKDGKLATAKAQDKVREKARDITKAREFDVVREQTADENREQLDDSMGFEGDVERGIHVDKRKLRDQFAEVQKQIEAVGKKLDGEQQFGNGAEEVVLRKQLARLTATLDGINARMAAMATGESLGSGQREIDPFGQIHQATGFNEKREPAPIGRDKGAQAPSLLGVKKGKDAAPKETQDEGPPLDEYTLTEKPAPSLDTALANEDYSHLNTAAEVDRFLNSAMKRYKELQAKDKELRDKDARLPILERKALRTLNNLFGPDSTADLNSFYDGVEGESIMRPTNRNDGELAPPPPRSQRETELRQAVHKAVQAGSTPDPKAVAAKKAALSEKARSGDPELLKALATSTDAKGLQRAVEHLNTGKVDMATAAAIRTANERLAELVRGSADVAYGMGTKRYSLMGYQLHQENQYQGFPATHDSPIRHEGKFDWRTHKGKGEGNAAFGAGTYLSTAEGTHKGYKKQFTARAEREGALSDEAKQLREALDENSDTIISLQQSRDENGPWRANVGGRFDHFQSQEEAQSAIDKRRKERLDRIAELEKMLVDKVNSEGKEYNLRYIRDEALPYVREKLREEAGGKPEKMQDLIDKATEDGRAMLSRLQEIKEKDRFGSKAPTYEVSVDIPSSQLLDWDKPLSEQGEQTKQAAAKAVKEHLSKQAGLKWEEDDLFDDTFTAKIKGNEYHVSPDVNRGSGFMVLLNDHSVVGRYKTLKEAKQAAEEDAMTSGLLEPHRTPSMDATGEQLYKRLVSKLGSQAAASEYLQSLGILGHRYAAAGGKNDKHPNYVIYDDSKITTNYVHFSKQDARRTAPNTAGPVNRRAVYDYMQRVFGPRIAIAWKNIMHAGEFERVVDQQGAWEDVIRLSVHSLNPLSPAYHESLHAFFAKLRDLKQGQVMDVLERAANSAPVMNQLRKLLANEPDALKQLNDPEERAAYMYQFWASGDLTVGDQTKTVLGKIADFIRSVLGIWSNDERALHILEYFHQGDFAKDLGQRNARDLVEANTMGVHRSKALEQAKKMTQPLRDLGEALGVAGGQRLRDTGIPALRELADAMKLHGTAEGEDAGYVPAARREHATRMNKLAKGLRDVSEQALRAALEALQSKSNAAIDALAKPEDRLAARAAKKVLRQHLDDAFDYMQGAGVRVNDLGYGKDYFPRVYDPAYISAHQAEFKAVLARHGVSDTQAVADKLMVTGGAEFTVEVDKPGMQHLKLRKLAFIPDDELAPFMRKDALEIISSYTLQAARRAEWSVRFGDDGKRIEALLRQAKREGATDGDLDAAQKFVRSVDGTLGDTINPEARRLMGNMIVYQNIRLLPLAIFSSVVDPMGVMVRGGTVGDAFKTFKRGVRETVKAFKKAAPDDDMTALAADIGTIDDAMLAHTMSAIYMQGMAGDTGRKFNDAFFRFNLMEQWNTSMRVGATEAAMSFLKRHRDGTASPHSKRWLAELGLQPGDVRLDAQGNVDVSDPQIKAAINRWVDGAVLRPDAVDKPIWMSDPHFALIAHLKQFVFSFHETILKRVAHEYQHGNYAPAMTLAGYVPIMIAADMIKGLIQGGGEVPEWKKDWGAEDYVWSGVERAGLLGTGQFAVDAMGRGVGSLAGPTLEQLGQAASVLGGRGEFAPLMVKSMPANALYAEALRATPEDPRTTG